MTKKEQMGFRDTIFNDWIRDELPDSVSGFRCSDIDFMLWNVNTKRFIILELKYRMVSPTQPQMDMFQRLNKWIIKGIDDDWQYLGFHLIQFENKCFNSGRCYLDKKEVSEEYLRHFLSLTW